MSQCWGQNINYVVIVQNSVDVTLNPLTADELVATGTVQVAVNAEAAVAFPAAKAASQTSIKIPDTTPGPN